jgi:hypothetical protein
LRQSFIVPPTTIAAKAENLSLFAGDMLTQAEISAVQAVSGRLLPMSELPTNTADVPRIPYRQHVYSVERPRSTHHYGQRKLLNSEVTFLIDNARKGDTVVYAGSAPGTHIPFLASLFSHLNLRYVLIDPRDFKLPRYPGVSRRIEVRKGFFTDEMAEAFSNRDDILFISDIRSGTDGPEIPTDDTVEGDMKRQEDWVLKMNPRACLLKYRLNYTKKGNSEYLAGDVRIQIWPGPKSTETRLEARRPYRVVPTDARDHEERMFFVNTILREWAAYDHGVPLALVPGLDSGFDSACEVRVWRQYLKVAPPEAVAALPNGDVAAQVAALINRASVALRRSLDPPDGPQRRM